MKILFIVDELPFPPRNGVTIPLANFIERLTPHHDLTLLYTTAKAIDDELQKQVTINKEMVKDVWISQCSKKSVFKRVLDELSISEIFSFCWVYDFSVIIPIAQDRNFDVIWTGMCGNITAGLIIRDSLAPHPLLIAGANDSISAALRRMAKLYLGKSTSIIHKLKGITQWVRVPVVRQIEVRLLEKADICLFQTEADRRLLDCASISKLHDKIMVVSNGVNESLFGIPFPSESDKDVLFLGELSGEYRFIVEWFVRNVWVKINEKYRHSRFTVVGANAPPDLRRTMSEIPNVIYKGFVKEIKQAFTGVGVMAAPVFKRYGLINKVIESMAAGVPVVGDQGSFNGIPGFQAGLHGAVADNAENMAKEIIELLDNYPRRMQIACNARSLVKQHFAWQPKVDYVMSQISSRIGPPAPQ